MGEHEKPLSLEEQLQLAGEVKDWRKTCDPENFLAEVFAGSLEYLDFRIAYRGGFMNYSYYLTVKRRGITLGNAVMSERTPEGRRIKELHENSKRIAEENSQRGKDEALVYARALIRKIV